MSYKLGVKTLPEPKSFSREVLETAQENITITGKSTKKITNRKERYTLVLQNLTQQQVDELYAEFNLQTVRTFTVDEPNLTISPVDVFIDIPQRVYNKTGLEYREDIELVLTEVT